MLKDKKQRPHKQKKTKEEKKISNYEHLKKKKKENSTVISSAIREGFAAVKVYDIVSISLLQMLMC